MSSQENQKKLRVFDMAWFQTYRAPGRRAYFAKVKETEDSWAAYREHSLKPRTRVLTFLGLPDRLRQQGEPRTARDIASMVFGIVMLPFSLVKNTAKLVTEFLPKAAYLGAKFKSVHYGRAGINRSVGKSIAMGVLAGMSYGLYFIGRAITSPSQGVRQAYKAAYSDKNTGKKKLLPLPARVGLALLSGFITAGVYAVLLPFVVTLAAPSLVVAGAALVAKSTVASAAVKGLALVGSFLTKAIGLAYAVAPVVAASSLAATAGTTASVVASEVDVRRKLSSTAKVSQGLGVEPGNGAESQPAVSPSGRVTSRVIDIPKPESGPEVFSENRGSFKL
ncbi:MAG TPA: hypothetical protein VFU82_04335 [Gammaproteobacteria bacterium]|nr:hypothetical protein [Gammaproteobacteria bacterium]